MENMIINDLYDRISKILKNDQQYTYNKIGERISACTGALRNLESYYANYPPLLDVAEIGAGLEYASKEHQEEMIRQMKYKMQQLRLLLPDIR